MKCSFCKKDHERGGYVVNRTNEGSDTICNACFDAYTIIKELEKKQGE